MVGVADRHGKRVGSIGARNLDAGEQPRDHRVNLSLFGSTRAHHRFLDQAGGIFADIEPRAGHRRDRDAAGVRELQGRLRVGVDEHLLDRSALWRMIGDQRGQHRVEMREPAWQRRPGIGLELAVGEVAEAIALSTNQPPAGGTKAGIETEKNHQNHISNWGSSSSGASWARSSQSFDGDAARLQRNVARSVLPSLTWMPDQVAPMYSALI
eukprot:Opistho-1_new@79650